MLWSSYCSACLAATAEVALWRAYSRSIGPEWLSLLRLRLQAVWPLRCGVLIGTDSRLSAVRLPWSSHCCVGDEGMCMDKTHILFRNSRGEHTKSYAAYYYWRTERQNKRRKA